jgi:hypothetical protein
MRGKRTEFGREDAFVVDGSLGVRHDVVDVLRRRQSDLLTSFVNPRILSAKHKAKQNKKYVRTREENVCDCVCVCVYIIHQKKRKKFMNTRRRNHKKREK